MNISDEDIEKLKIQKDLEELKWWREVIAVRFMPGTLPPVGTIPCGVQFTVVGGKPNWINYNRR